MDCGSVNGGNSRPVTAVVDIDFDESLMSFTGATDNSASAAVDGLIQDRSASGRVGWALAGDWDPDASTSGTLADPCSTGFLENAGWLAEYHFTAGGSPASTRLHLRRQSDATPFALSFADFCSSEAFTPENGGIDEVIDATVYISAVCPAGLFSDGFESGDTDQWTAATP